MPYFYELLITKVRGIQTSSSDIVHIAEPEYHCDGVHEGGIYTYYNFGQDLFESIRNVGFTKVEIGLSYDVFFWLH